ncbi:MAG: TonB family protein [Sandaracinaceae bacterium]
MALNEGQVLAGKYRIERLLGEGGMGAVYVATNTVLQRKVALKVMNERFASVPAAVERFHREAIAASKVSHPSICQVFDAGQHEGKPWIAMEMLEGESLAERIERGPMSVDEVVRMASGALSALAEVHDEGIVHRDLKPDNIFLARSRSGSWVPKVLDFGVAKDTSEGQLNKLTATGAVVGTAYYLSPEQAKGLPDIDPRTDVYAIGVVLYECLSGHMPYEAETITQLIAKMFTEEPRPLDMVAPDVPKQVAAVVNRCLAQEREDRFQTARALLAALEAASRGEYAGAAAASQPGIGAAHSHAGVSHSGLSGVSQPGTPIPQTALGDPRVGTHPTALLPDGLGGASGAGLPAQTPMPQSSMPHMHSAMTQSEMGGGGGSKVGLIAGLAVLFLLGASATIGGAFFLMGGEEESEGVANAAVRTSTPQPGPGTATTAPPPGEDPPLEPSPAADTPTDDGAGNGAEDGAEDGADDGTPPGEDVAEEDETPRPATAAPRRGRRRGRTPQPTPEPLAQPAAPTPAPPSPVAPSPAPAPARGPGLSTVQVMGAIQGRMAYLQSRCFERRARRVPGLQGVVTIGWTIGPDGRVQNANVVHNGTGDEWLGNCTRNVVRDTPFPAAANGRPTPARYPFRFTPR